MGEVYKARDTRLDRTVAIKTLPPHVAAAPDLRERFEREARAISQLNHANGEVSPSGRWLAYESDESGRREICVRPFPAVDSRRWQISTGGGRRPAWARNGRELFYAAADEQMMAVSVSADAGREFTYGRPTPLFSVRPYVFESTFNGRSYDVAADGRFVVIKEPAGAAADVQTIVVVEHWISEVRKRLGQ